MSSVFKQLHGLEGTSSGSHDQLGNILRGEEYRRCVQNPEGDGLVSFVDYLDKARCPLLRHDTPPTAERPS